MGHGADIMAEGRENPEAYLQTLLGVLAAARAMERDCMLLVALGAGRDHTFNPVEFELELKKLVENLRSPGVRD